MEEGLLLENPDGRLNPSELTRKFARVEKVICETFDAYRDKSRALSIESPMRALPMKHGGHPDIEKLLAALESNLPKNCHLSYWPYQCGWEEGVHSDGWSVEYPCDLKIPGKGDGR